MWFLVCLLGGQFIELLLVYFFPQLLAPLALLPAGPERSIEIPLHAANAMSTVHAGASDYRTSAGVRSLDVSRLPGASRIDTTDATLLFSRRPARVVARTPWDLRRHARPLVCVEMRNGDDRIVLRPRYFPTAALSLVAAMIVACVELGSGGPLMLIVFALPVIAVFGAREARRHVDAIAAEISARVGHLEYLASDARIVTEPPSRAIDARPNATRVAVLDAVAPREEEDEEQERRRRRSL